jgi:hypothetical protein
MARTFNPTGSKYSQRTGCPVSAPPYTLACWANPTASNTGALVGFASSNGLTVEQMFFNATSTKLYFSGASSIAGPAMTLNTWQHCAAVLSSTTSVAIYVNGGTAITGNPSTGAGYNFTGVGCWYESTDGPSNIFTGSIAEVGIWNVALTAAEIAALATGVQPRYVRPGSLVAYYPLWGLSGSSTEPDLSGSANNLTLTGSPTQANHGPVTRFTRKDRGMIDQGAPAAPIRPPLSIAYFE